MTTMMTSRSSDGTPRLNVWTNHRISYDDMVLILMNEDLVYGLKPNLNWGDIYRIVKASLERGGNDVLEKLRHGEAMDTSRAKATRVLAPHKKKFEVRNV